VPAGAEAWCAPLAVPSSQVLGLGPNDSLGAVQEGRRAGRSGTTAAGSLALPWNSPSRPLWCATRSTPHRRPTLPPSTAVPGALGSPPTTRSPTTFGTFALGGTPTSANHGEAPAAWFVDAAGVGPHLAGGAGSVDALDGPHRVL